MIQCSGQLINELHAGLTLLYVTAVSYIGTTPVYFLKEDFKQEGNSYTQAIDTSGLSIGVAVQRTVSLTLLNLNDKFIDFDFKHAVFTVYINADLTTGETEQIKLGRFNVIKADTSSSIITLSLVDDMLLADTEFTTNLTFPVTAGDLLADVCNTCGISLGDTSFQNDNVLLYKQPTKITCREVIANIALIACGVAIFDGDNFLRIKTIQVDALSEQDWIRVPSYYAMSSDKPLGWWYHQSETFTNYDSLIYPTSSSSTRYREWEGCIQVTKEYYESITISRTNNYIIIPIDWQQLKPTPSGGQGALYGRLNLSIGDKILSLLLAGTGIMYKFVSDTVTTYNDYQIVFPNSFSDQNYGSQLTVQFYKYRNSTQPNIRLSFGPDYYAQNLTSIVLDCKWYGDSYYYASAVGNGARVGGNFNFDETYHYDGGTFLNIDNSFNMTDAISIKYEKSGIQGCKAIINYSGQFAGNTGTKALKYGRTWNYDKSNENSLILDLSKCIFLETNSDNWSDRTTGENQLNTIGSAIANVLCTTRQRFTLAGGYDFVGSLWFYPFIATVTETPFVEINDPCYFEQQGIMYRSFISDIDFVFGSVTSLSNNTKNQSQLTISTPSTIVSVANSINTVNRNIQPYETQVEQLNNLANNALPYYITKEVNGNSIITYYHNNSTLSSSTVVYKICKEGIFLSHDGGTTWISGFDQDGNAVIYTASIGQLLASKLTVLNDAYIKNHSSPIGTIKNASSSSTASLSSTTSMTKIADLTTLEPGVWVISARIQFPSNSTGTRGGAIYSNGTQQGTSYILLPAGGSIISQSMSAIVNSTSNMDIDLYARQNSGSAMTVTYYWKAVRIQ